MLDPLPISPSGPVRGSIRPPGSKSITNRALVCAALAEGPSTLRGALDSEDTRIMRDCLTRLGVAIQAFDEGTRLELTGCRGRWPATSAELWVGNSGTTARFLAAAMALGEGRFRIDGSPRMRQRPLQDLLDGLAQLGVPAAGEAAGGCPPVEIEARGLPGGTARVRGVVSSQFLSGLLMAAPYASSPTRLEVEGPLVSAPYVDMTLAVMESFGVRVARRGARFDVPRACYQGRVYPIEPDASAASYFLAAAAVTGGEITIAGLGPRSLQGDWAFADVLQRMGCRVERFDDTLRLQGAPLVAVDVDMNAISDTVPTLAAVALFALGPSTITNVAHMRHKETDRLAALAAELRKLGAEVDERADGLRIVPRTLQGAQLATYDDHRMAMSLALVGLRVPGVRIEDPACVGKTYPGYFADLAKIVQPRS